MDTWKTYVIGVVLLIAGAYGGWEFASYRIDELHAAIGKLNQKVYGVYEEFGRTQEKFENLYEKANTLEKNRIQYLWF